MLAGILVLCSGGALGHDPGLSAAQVRIFPDKIVADVSFAASDLEQIERIDSSGLAVVAEKLLNVKGDGRKLALHEFSVKNVDGNSMHFMLEFSNEHEAELQISAPVLADLPRGHKQFFSLRDRENNVLAERMLSAGTNELTIDLRRIYPSTGTGESMFHFLKLGIEHILTGYDHLAFLLALLLAGSSLRSNARIITSFTIAHSLTLAMATFGVVRIPSSVVEPLIAASIVFVGVENLVRRRLMARWLLTFGFGLIHGLGFASVLQGLGIGAGGFQAAVTPLFSFNLGVEFGQFAVAALVLPLVWKLQRRPSFVLRHVPALSLLIAISGVYWLVVRTLM